MIARIQQTVVFLLLAGLGAWVWHILPDYSHICMPFMALAGVYISYIAILFIVIHYLNRSNPQPRATLWALFQACLREASTAPSVFLWRQPFRAQAIPDYLPSSKQAGVVFIHGFFCNRAFWSPWMRQLQAQNRAFASVTLEPAFGSIDDYAAIVEAAVAKVTQATGQTPALICHSMGGLAARAWLMSSAANDDRIKRVITIGTPHFGTALSTEKALLPFTNTHQMQRLGAWTQQLAKDEPPTRYGKFTCWYSNCDNIVVPTSTAMLPGADNRLVTAQGHVSMAFSPRVMHESLALLD
jgi:pimeloyl-ACP methyl ester carboxylesterase